MDSQSRFEQWVSTQSVVTKYGAKLHKGITGRYKDLRIEQRFAAWNAALAQQASRRAGEDVELSGDELQEFLDTCEQFEDCSETTTCDATLMRWAQMRLLECVRYEVTIRGDKLLAAARKAKEGG